MRYLLLIIVSFILMSFASVDVEPIKLTLPIILALIVGIWEVVMRIIPATTNWSFVKHILALLTWLSDYLNRKNK